MKLIFLFLLLSTTYSLALANCSEKEWWKNTIVYQILVPSFKDSNSDGIGDLRGIIQKLDYLKDIGVETIWLTPFYSGPNGDIGYDISNHTEVGKDFGTMNDFNELLKSVHDKGMKLLIEFVPNHSSDKHDWFIKSAQKVDGYSDFYVWMPEVNGSIPNNWLSKRSGSMWKFHPHRQEYYLHQFLDELPDLNYRSTTLVTEMEKILEFWLEKGVDGFGMDSILKLYEDAKFQNETKLISTSLADNDPNAYDHIYTIDQPETYQMLYHWRSILDKYSNKTKTTSQKIIITEAYSPSLEKVSKYFGSGEKQGTHLSVNYELMNKFGPESNSRDLESVINNYIKTLPAGKWHSWMVGGHSIKRIASRYGSEMVDALNMLTLLLPGTAVVFAGDEIGMESPFIRYEDQRDPEGYIYGKDNYQKVSRDGSRIPFQWNNQDNAGFSKVKSWLPPNPNYWVLNAESQMKDKRSHYSIFKELTFLRSTSKAIRLGDYSVTSLSDYVFALTRSYQQSSVYVVINLNSRTENVDLSELIHNGDVSIYSSSVNSGLQNAKLEINGKPSIVLRSKASVVLTKNYNPTECKSSALKILPGSIVFIWTLIYIVLLK